MERAGAAFLGEEDARQLRQFMFPLGRLNVEVVGKGATWIAQQAGIRVGPKTKVLVAGFDAAIPEEPLTHEKLSPVLGMIRVSDADAGIATARAIVRIAGAGHSAAIHSHNPGTVLRYAAEVPVLRVSVNVGNSTGSSGLDTHLAPTMTVGTGFVGRSALGENLQPKHLVDWTRIAYNADPSEALPSYDGMDPWTTHDQPVPAYPVASNDHRGAPPSHALDRLADTVSRRVSSSGQGADDAAFRAEVRRLVAAELSQLLKG